MRISLLSSRRRLQNLTSETSLRLLRRRNSQWMTKNRRRSLIGYLELKTEKSQLKLKLPLKQSTATNKTTAYGLIKYDYLPYYNFCLNLIFMNAHNLLYNNKFNLLIL